MNNATEIRAGLSFGCYPRSREIGAVLWPALAKPPAWPHFPEGGLARQSVGATPKPGWFGDCFRVLTDPRSPGARRHDLPEILTIALCTVLCGGQTAVDMAVFAEAKQDFLRRFLALRNGVPSHDTFSRVFRRLDPDEFRACFQKFMARFNDAGTGIIAIDGKVVQRSFDAKHARSAMRMVSAWCCDTRLVLAQIAIADKSSEGAAVAKLLDILSLNGTIITTDALHCQREISRRIIAKGGDYALALKSNHARLLADVARLFEERRHEAGRCHVTRDRSHGRRETRASFVATGVEELARRYQWPGLTAVGKVLRTRRMTADKTSRPAVETAYYLLSTPLSPERLGHVVRSHWGVENRLHWVLNVVMNEDQLRSTKDHSPYNLAILRHLALNLMHKDRSKVSLRGKFNLAGWKDEFLAQLLAQA